MGGEKPVPDANTGMIHKARLHSHFSDLEFHFLQLLDRNRPRHSRRLTGKTEVSIWLARMVASPSRAPSYPRTRSEFLLIIGRKKKWQTLDMIPVSMRNQNSQLDWPRLEFLFQGDAQRRMPEPASRMMISPSARTSMQLVFPP